MIVVPKPSMKAAAAKAVVAAGVLSDANGKRKRAGDSLVGPESDKRVRVSPPDGDVITLD